MPRQLTFDLPTRTALGREDFFVSNANKLAAAQIDAWRSWPSRKFLLLGPSGSGKTHLAHVWAASANAVFVEVGGAAKMIAGRNVVVDDADKWRGKEEEESLFHLHNAVLSKGGSLLLTSTAPPSSWDTALPDLASRIQATPTARIAGPDDALLTALLVKLFADRQLEVSANLIGYAVPRIERSAAAVARFVDDLDRLALSEGKPVNRTLASRLLDNAIEEGE